MSIICVSVCLSVRKDMSGRNHTRDLYQILCMLPMSVARSSSGKLTIGRIACRREGADGRAFTARAKCNLRLSCYNLAVKRPSSSVQRRINADDRKKQHVTVAGCLSFAMVDDIALIGRKKRSSAAVYRLAALGGDIASLDVHGNLHSALSAACS